MMGWKFKEGVVPPFCLITISTKNGKHQVIPTYRTQEQLNNYLEELKQFKKELEIANLWDKKVSIKKRIEK